MSFTIKYDINVTIPFNFQAVTALFNDTGAHLDFSPEGGGSNTWRYEVQIVPDMDGDGLRGPDDECPRLSNRGALDADRDGCPGPFKQIKAVLRTVGFATPDATTFRRFALLGLPPHAKVVIASGSRREELTASNGGVASSKRFTRRLRTGTKIAISVTKPRYVGYFARYRIQAGAKLVGRTRCIPAYGRQQPTRCTAELLGR